MVEAITMIYILCIILLIYAAHDDHFFIFIGSTIMAIILSVIIIAAFVYEYFGTGIEDRPVMLLALGTCWTIISYGLLSIPYTHIIKPIFKSIQEKKEIQLEYEKKKREIELQNLKQQPTQQIINELTIYQKCAVKLININNLSYYCNDEIKSKVKDLTMTVSKAIAILEKENKIKILEKLHNIHLDSLETVFEMYKDTLYKMNQTIVTECIKSVENYIKETINHAEEKDNILITAELNFVKAEAETSTVRGVQ